MEIKLKNCILAYKKATSIAMTLQNTFYTITTGDVKASNYRLGSTELIHLEQGKKIKFSGLKGIGGSKTPLYVEWVKYSSETANVSNFVTSSDSTFIHNSDGNDTFEFTIESDGYYGFSFANNPTKDTTLCPNTDYSPIHYIVY